MFYIILLLYIYMIIINFLIGSLFLGYIRALCNFMSNYLYYILYIGIICVQGLSVFKDYLCSRIIIVISFYYIIYRYIIGSM